MSIFWDILKIRASIKIQDSIWEELNQTKRMAERESIQKNANKILEVVNNNIFNEERKKKKID